MDDLLSLAVGLADRDHLFASYREQLPCQPHRRKRSARR